MEKTEFNSKYEVIKDNMENYLKSDKFKNDI